MLNKKNQFFSMSYLRWVDQASLAYADPRFKVASSMCKPHLDPKISSFFWGEKETTNITKLQK